MPYSSLHVEVIVHSTLVMDVVMGDISHSSCNISIVSKYSH